jgi:hypothetical protein
MGRAWDSVTTFASAAAIALAFCAPAAADELPSYATNVETIRGTIAALPGKYSLTLADERGFSDSVTLRAGTTISPAGVALAVGEPVVITGHSHGSTFLADAIENDTSNGDGSGGTSYDYGASDDGYAPYDYAVPAYAPPFGYGFGYGSFGFGFGYYGYYGYPGFRGYNPCCYYRGGYYGPSYGGGVHYHIVHPPYPNQPLSAPRGGVRSAPSGGSRSAPSGGRR